jgi:SAM-dependent methyltransferase
MSDGGYLLDNQASEAGQRLEALATLFDPSTFRHLTDLGIAPGWSCWELGAGGPSVPRWLASQVRPSGRVLATDIDISWALASADGIVEVREHDVAGNELPSESFDLVHARLVLVHVTDRERALHNAVRSLRPGGWLLLEDADPALQPLSCLDAQGPEDELANKIRAGFRTLLARRGVDLAYGRKLPRLMRSAGLVDVGADAYFPVSHPACRLLETATISQIRDDLVTHEIAASEEIDQHLVNVASGRLDLAQPPMISAWGRRP